MVLMRSGLRSMMTTVRPASLNPRVRSAPVLPNPQMMQKGSAIRATRFVKRRSATDCWKTGFCTRRTIEPSA